MEIRPAREEDLPAIIDLMRSSLGESMIPKSESLWKWKHEENPFGKSYVLVAEENGELIGLRAFMQWKWIWQGKTYRAIRAVDTATHPDHQGKGIFKKLTLQQAEMCKNEGVDFIFNTPNDQSRPGYLKMGWVAQGKMPLKIKITRPFALAYAKFFDKDKYKNVVQDPSPEQVWDENVLDLIKTHKHQHTKQLATPVSAEYIRWRYAENPLFRYNYFTDHKNYILISRNKYQGFAKELRLVEFILLNPDKNINSSIKREVNRFCAQHKIDFISFSGQQFKNYTQYFKWMGIIPVKPLGPIVTVRDLNMGNDFEKLLETGNWNYSVGDLELF